MDSNLGIAIQTVGYFFIAFSHSIKSFFQNQVTLDQWEFSHYF